MFKSSFRAQLEAEQQTVPAVSYEEEETLYRGELIKFIEGARDQRDGEHDEFDGMTYLEAYETNSKTGNSYIEPNVNEGDTKLSSGVTLEKTNTLLSSLLNFNFEPNISAFDDRNYEIYELGENFEALVKKSRQIENPSYNKKRSLIYKELLDQGTVFVEDVLIEWQDVEKIMEPISWAEGVKIKKTWEKKLGKVQRELRCTLISGPNMYLGDIKQAFIEYQPYIFTRQVMSYAEAESIFRNWERWENVSRNMQSFNSSSETNLKYHNWSLEALKKNHVEIIKYQNKWKNEFMLMINGVLMLPVGFPLSAITGGSRYSIAQGMIEPISYFFAYGKSMASKTKVDQALLTEQYKSLIMKTRKSYKPSVANNTGQILTSRMFLAGTITPNVDPNLINEIGNNEGVTQAEFNVLEFLKRVIDEKTVSSVFQGQTTEGGQTATEIMELKKQSMMKLGLPIMGIMNLEYDMAWLRLHGVLQHWTQVQDQRVNEITGKLEDVYASFTVEDTLEDGTLGKRIIKFSPENKTSEQIRAEEDILSRKEKVRVTYILPEILAQVKINWYITIEPTEKNVDALERAQFSKSIVEGFQLFGQQSFSLDYIKTQWAQKNKFDKDQLFVKQQPMNPMLQANPMEQGNSMQNPSMRSIPQEGGNINRQVLATLPKTPAPSVNTLLRR